MLPSFLLSQQINTGNQQNVSCNVQKALGTLYSKQSEKDFAGFSGGDWAGDLSDYKSTHGMHLRNCCQLEK